MPVAAALPSIDELNRLSAEECAAALAPLFEGAPQFLTRLAMARPFAGYAELWPTALRIARAMPEAEQVELIDAHPRLGGSPASVSAMSFREQGYDQASAVVDDAEGGARTAADRLAAELERLNVAYESRFGFRFCVFVNGRSRQALLPVMAAALEADRATEIRRALGEVVAIAADRARTLPSQ